MFRAIPTANKLCSQKWDDRNFKLHKKRLRSMKAAIDNKPPTRYTHLVQNLKKAQVEEERYSEIERENRILLQKMSHIMQKSPFADVKKPPSGKSLNKEYRKKELMRITMENQAILKRIQHKEPYYNHLEWQRDRKQNEGYLKRICQYPRVQTASPSSRKGKRSLRTTTAPGRSLYAEAGEWDMPRRGGSRGSGRHQVETPDSYGDSTALSDEDEV